MSSRNNEKQAKIIEEVLECLHQNLQNLQKKLNDELIRNILSSKKSRANTVLEIDLDTENSYFLPNKDGKKTRVGLLTAIESAKRDNLIDINEYQGAKEEVVEKYVKAFVDNEELWKGENLRVLGFNDELTGVISKIVPLPPYQLMFISDEGTKTYLSLDSLRLGSLFKILNKCLGHLEE